MDIQLKQLQKVDIRKVWNHEAVDFTKWLAREENLQQLSEEVGVGIKLIDIEAEVGDFNVDILAEEESSERKIVIENQLESTNHDHLGKIITYASGYDAGIVIWIVKNARPEHEQAVNWLNERTDDQTFFFLLQIEVWQIGESNYAPKFQVIASPNNWAKALKSSMSDRKLTDTKILQQEYWNSLIEFSEETGSKVKFTRAARPQHWYDISVGTSDCHIALTVNSKEQLLGCELYIPRDKALFQFLKMQKDSIEAKMEQKLDWNELENKKASRIQLLTSADFQDRSDWESQFQWFVKQANLFDKAFRKYLKKYKTEPVG